VIKTGIKTKLSRDRISSHPHTEQYNTKTYSTLLAIHLLLKVGIKPVSKTSRF